jgi:hypothetical protein
LFFVSHELGHLVANRDERSYTTFVRQDAELEDRIANAVLKLCRHADEFAKYKFDLPGFQAVVQPESEVRGEVRKVAEQVDDALEVNHATYFADEVAADEVATAILVAHLQEIGRKDALVGHQYRYLLCEGLFGAALYTWYRDLFTFGEKLGLGHGANSQALVVEMMKERGSYIKAASMFGDVHRFTLLRAALAMEAILRAGSDFFDRPVDQRTIWWKKSAPAAIGGESGHWWQKMRFVWKPAPDVDAEFLEQFWQAESLQRYYLLCITMDTAVKVAYVGCATGWMLEADRRRETAQLFMMTFESIAAAVARLRRFA